MTAPKVRTQFVVGNIYTTDGKDLWRCVSYTPEPYVVMEPIGEGEQMVGVESKMANFVRLVPEADPPARKKRRYEKKVVPAES
jgi:hypothetical protein